LTYIIKHSFIFRSEAGTSTTLYCCRHAYEIGKVVLCA